MHEKRQMRDVFPACLLTGGRPCVVVGGGIVATRKVRALLDAGAAITVVSPMLADDLAALHSAHMITHVPRVFEPHDIEGAFIVCAATDDRKVNRRIVACCHEHHVLCSSVDANWIEGDFVSPATMRDKGLIVSISSGGRSCRRSRLLKESLSRHIAALEHVDLLVMGTSHHQMKAEERGPLHLAHARMAHAGAMLRRVWGLHEFFLLNTCNRIEIVALAARDDASEQVMARVLGFDRLRTGAYYVHHGFDAFAHVAMVTAGILSQSPGEQHIVAQMKSAVEAAIKADWAGGSMKELFSAALRVSRDVRIAVQPLLGGREIEDLAADYITLLHPRHAGLRVLVVGTGNVGTGIVRHCAAARMPCDWCYHQTKPVVEPAWKDRVRVWPMTDLRSRLQSADIVVCATTRPGYVLRKSHASYIDRNKDVLVIDLAMPHNVDPALAQARSRIKLLDLDALKHQGQPGAADLARARTLAKRTIARQRALYERIVEAFAVQHR